jgi:hypothetical protein
MDTLDGFAADVVRAFDKTVQGQKLVVNLFAKSSFDLYYLFYLRKRKLAPATNHISGDDESDF